MNRSARPCGGFSTFPRAAARAESQGRELVVPHTPFIAAYVVTAGWVRILRILHGAQVWPDDIDPN
jgi:plasmid stabilization system protein ParE